MGWVWQSKVPWKDTNPGTYLGWINLLLHEWPVNCLVLCNLFIHDLSGNVVWLDHTFEMYVPDGNILPPLENATNKWFLHQAAARRHFGLSSSIPYEQVLPFVFNEGPKQTINTICCNLFKYYLVVMQTLGHHSCFLHKGTQCNRKQIQITTSVVSC